MDYFIIKTRESQNGLAVNIHFRRPRNNLLNRRNPLPSRPRGQPRQIRVREQSDTCNTRNNILNRGTPGVSTRPRGRPRRVGLRGDQPNTSNERNNIQNQEHSVTFGPPGGRSRQTGVRELPNASNTRNNSPNQENSMWPSRSHEQPRRMGILELLNAFNGLQYSPEQSFGRIPNCTICLDNQANMVFIPCGHLCTCERCADIQQESETICPLCRRQIDVVTRVFI